MLYTTNYHGVAHQLYIKNKQANIQTNRKKISNGCLPEAGGEQGEMDEGSQKT